MILIMGLELCISLTDVFIAGRIGKEVQASVGLVSQVYFIFVVIANALTVGTVSVVSRLFSAADRRALSNTIHTLLITTAGAGFLLGGLGIVLAPVLIRVLDVPPPLRDYGIPLVRIYAASLIFHYLLINTNGILRASGRVKTSLRTMAGVCAVNVGLNFYLVFGTSLGFRGIAVSTAVSMVLGALLNIAAVRTLISGPRRFSPASVGRVARIGWPSGVTQVAWQLGATFLFLIIGHLPRHPVEVMAALTNGLRIEAAIYLPAFALNMANAVMVGNLLGEGRDRDAFRSGVITALFGVGLITLLTVAVVLNAERLAGMLSDNAVVTRETVRYIYISMISEPFMAWAVILGGALNGAGDTRGVMRIIILSLWLVRIPGSYIFGIGLGYGPMAFWWCMNVSIFVHTIFLTRRFFARRWLQEAGRR